MHVALAFAFAFTAVLASETAPAINEQSSSTKQRESRLTSEAVAAVRNATDMRREYSISVTMVNDGSDVAVVQQNYVFPDAVEVKSFTLQENGYKAKKSEYDQSLTQWVGGTVILSQSVTKQADMTYINHLAQAINQGAKTFQKLATTILVNEGNSVGGYISSPNYPTSYPNEADFTWLIVYQPGNIVQIEMTFYDIEECCDHLMIYDGFNITNHPLAKFQGLYTPGSSDNVVHSTQPKMFIRFRSDCTTTSRGFRASYINEPVDVPPPPMSCGSVQLTNENSGNIQSPNYPYSYADNMNCSWPVETYVNTRVKFAINEFVIGTDDTVTFYDGTPSVPGDKIISLSSNSYTGYPIYASTNQAFVLFLSGSSPNDADKFIISYTGENYPETTPEPTPVSTTLEIEQTTTPVTDDRCPDVYYDSNEGYIKSPKYPLNYENDMHCKTWVRTSQYLHIMLTVQFFSLDSGDNLYIYNDYNGNLLTTFSNGYAYGYSWIAPTNHIQIVFESNSQRTSKGYYFHYIAVYDNYTPPQLACGGPIPFNEGTITSPGFGTQDYGNYLDCVWTVAVTAKMHVLFTVVFFRTEACCDTAGFYAGIPVDPPTTAAVAYLNGVVRVGTQVVVDDDQAWVKFTTNNSGGDIGFVVAYREVEAGYTPNRGAAYEKQRGSSVIDGQIKSGNIQWHNFSNELTSNDEKGLPQDQREK